MFTTDQWSLQVASLTSCLNKHGLQTYSASPKENMSLRYSVAAGAAPMTSLSYPHGFFERSEVWWGFSQMPVNSWSWEASCLTAWAAPGLLALPVLCAG